MLLKSNITNQPETSAFYLKTTHHQQSAVKCAKIYKLLSYHKKLGSSGGGKMEHPIQQNNINENITAK